MAKFTPTLGSTTVQVVKAAVAYDDIYNNNTLILLIYNALYVNGMENNLIPPFMMRLAQLELNKEPKFITTDPTPEPHSMYCPRTDVRIHFSLKGIV